MPAIHRRSAIRQLVTMFGAAPFLEAQQAGDPLIEGGSEDEVALHDNRAAFNKIVIRPRALVKIDKIDLSPELFGQKLPYPILLGKRPVHFQLTTGGELRNTQSMKAFVKRTEGAGASGICLSTDIIFVSHRDRNIHSKFERPWCEVGFPPRDAQGKLPLSPNPELAGVYPERAFPTPEWNDLKELRSLTKLPILVKGIMRAEDARLCVESGASGILVSNHGARQLDHVGATIEAPPEVVEAVQRKIPVLMDGGIRRGTDILKALALGANAVCCARPYLYGLAAFGGPGVERVLELLRTELALDMCLAGVPNLAAIDRSLVRIRNGAATCRSTVMERSPVSAAQLCTRQAFSPVSPDWRTS
jgi:4-hydroxymandelate oxidase